MEKNSVFPAVIKNKSVIIIFESFRKKGHQIYLAGGCVRDIYLGITPADFDFCTDASPEEVMKMFPKAVPSGISHGTVTIVTDKEHFEITSFRLGSETLQEDCGKRDFTINSMAMDSEFRIIDYYNGMKDIRNGIIRATGDPEKRIKEDFLRILRAFRFSSRYDFRIDQKLLNTVEAFSENIKTVSLERVRDEILKIMTCNSNRICQLFFQMSDAGLLRHILPELEILRGFSQKSRHHDLDVFSHSLKTAEKMAELTSDPVLRLIALLHDTGKISTRAGENGSYTFHGHEKTGSEIICSIFNRLKMSNRECELAKNLVLHHLELKKIADSSIKAYSRFAVRNADFLDQLLLLNQADCEKGSLEAEVLCIRKIMAEARSRGAVMPLLSGFEIMKITGLKQGRKIGDLKGALLEKQLAGEIIDREQAVTFIEKEGSGQDKSDNLQIC